MKVLIINAIEMRDYKLLVEYLNSLYANFYYTLCK